MSRSKENVETILTETLRSTPQEEMDAAAARVLQCLRSESPIMQEVMQDVVFPRRRTQPVLRLTVGIACAAVILAMAFIPGLLTTQHAVVETAGGGLHRVFEKNAASLKAGDTVSLGDTVRTTGVTSAVLRLNDGSGIEVRANSELTLEKASDGIRIRLKEGDILVEAAKQGSSHLYVQTKDVTVAVVGTVFLVKAEVEGSRVAVLEGQVLVQQGSTSKKLLQGEEVSTNSKMESRPVSEELSWSRRAETHMAQAQQPALPPPVPSERLEFEAVSLKPEAPTGPIPPDEPGYGGGGPECLGIDGRFGTLVFIGAPLGRCVGRHVSLMWMIDAAYGLGNNAPTRIVQTGYSDPGGRSMQFEPWISNLWDNGFSLDAKAENPSTTTKDQLQQMLQSMLAERFKLSITREMRPVRELGLIVARGGPKLQQAPAGSEENVRFTQNVSGGVRQIRVSGNGGLKAFALALQPYRVVDKTGITGIYTFNLSFEVPIPPPTGNEGGPRAGGGGGSPETSPWFMAMQDALQVQLGLRVEYTTVPAEFIIINHVEKPSEN